MAEKWVDQPLALPKDPGAYLLWIRLKRAVRIPSHLGEKIGPALLLYAGSAYGPGGIRARCTRHLKQHKVPRWHVDSLTGGASELRVLPVVGGNECRLVEKLRKTGRVSFPVPGFGSSDCTTCESHLLSPGKMTLQQVSELC
ncbi:MAG: GIY-YIG nuclease family protein [Planctomycetota bacterium]|nr:GIY-YIG nuclease family protein [Planctomycetota bacterium]